MTLARLALGLLLALAATMATAATAPPARIVSLLVTVGADAGQADRLQAAFRKLGAVTLRADDPSDSMLRTALRGFATEAATADVAIALVLAPSLRFGERDFVAPAGLTLRRGSDLLTRSVPLTAFARAADLAGTGGAVIAVGLPATLTLPEGVTATATAPGRVGDVSPVVFVEAAALPAFLDALEIGTEGARVDLAELLRAVSGLPGASASYLFDRPVPLREPAAVVTLAPAGPEVTAAPASPPPPAPEIALSPETLAAFEASTPRALRRDVQRSLNIAGFYQGRIDGIFGAQTRAAIEAWQAAQGLPVTGYLTPAAFDALRVPTLTDAGTTPPAQ